MSDERRPAADADRTRRYTRVLSAALIPFLVAAFVLLYLLPSTTDSLFAWTIEPSMTAMLLGSAYVGGIWFFSLVARSARWHPVRWGFPAVLTFATLLLVATILHWDRFHFGHLSFIVWVILYATTPFLIAVALLIQRGQDPGVPDSRDYHLPRALRILLAVIGLAALVAGVVLFISPALLVESWAWSLTPLTARIIGAVLTLPGMVNVWMLVDPRWSSFRGVFQAQLVSLGFILLALVLARGDLDWSHPATPGVVAGFVFSGVAYTAFYLFCERRARAA